MFLVVESKKRESIFGRRVSSLSRRGSAISRRSSVASNMNSLKESTLTSIKSETIMDEIDEEDEEKTPNCPLNVPVNKVVNLSSNKPKQLTTVDEHKKEEGRKPNPKKFKQAYNKIKKDLFQ
jgi:hypothetical protein